MRHLLKTIVVGLVVMLWAGVAAAQSEYRVKPGDILTVEVLEDPSLNRNVAVLPDGRFSFPFAGTLAASGLTINQVQSNIVKAIGSNFASPPTVFVSVNPAPAPIQPASLGRGAGVPLTETITIYLMGEVGAPGPKNIEPGVTFLQALSQSGGLTNFAATKRIQLRRAGSQQVTTFNYKAISEGAVISQDPVLREGDVILVPERRLFE